MSDAMRILREHGIQPSAQRLAVADYVLHTDHHPSADQVWQSVREGFPAISRATVYNTLNLFVDRGLLRQLVLAEGNVVFDPNTTRHHHFIDDRTGRIYDVPWDALDVPEPALDGYEVHEFMVVMRGRKKRR